MDKVTVKRDSAPFINCKSSKLSPLSTNIEKPLRKRGSHYSGVDSLIFQMPGDLPGRLTELAPAANGQWLPRLRRAGPSTSLDGASGIRIPLALEVYHRILTLPTARGRVCILTESGLKHYQISPRNGCLNSSMRDNRVTGGHLY